MTVTNALTGAFLVTGLFLLLCPVSGPAQETDTPPHAAVFDLLSETWVKKPSVRFDRPLPAGSLFKIVTAAAALESGLSGDESHVCDGELCWYEPGHGRLLLRGALAQSCTSYFLELMKTLEADRVSSLAVDLGFEPGGRIETPQAYAGDDPSLRIQPTHAAMLMAFVATGRPLSGEKPFRETTRLEIRQALIESVALGTSSELGRYVPHAAAKTGTAFDSNRELYGWCAGFLPDTAPRYAFAVAVRGKTSRQGAVPAAARLLRTLRWNESETHRESRY